MSTKLLATVPALALSLLASCGTEGSPAPTTETDTENTVPVVLAVNEPLAYFARRIGGALVDASYPGPRDGDPAFWEPNRDAVRAFQSADLVLRNGADYAKWMETASIAEGRVVDTSADFRARLIEVEGAVTHSHGPEGDHSHAGYAFTTWLDPELAALHARAVHAALAELLPDESATLDANLATLLDDLEAWHGELRGAVAPGADLAILGSHPVYQYLRRALGLNLRSVHWEPDVLPSSEAWSDLDALLADHPAAWMMWEGEPLPETIAKLDERGVGSFVFDPFGAGSDEVGEDFLTVMRANAARLEAAFSR